MHRRELLRGAAAAAALTLLPAEAHAAWARVDELEAAAGHAPKADVVFSPEQARLLASLADTIIPRTGTPGATDVGVPAFIAVIVGENYTATERSTFFAALDAVDALAKSLGGSNFAMLSDASRRTVMDALEKPADRTTPAARGYARIKSLIVTGYFTSERVQKDVLHTIVMPGSFNGSAPYVNKSGAPSK